MLFEDFVIFMDGSKEELKYIFEENRKRIDDFYDSTVISDIQEMNKEVKDISKSIKCLYEKFWNHFSLITNVIISKSNGRLVVQKELTIREKEIYNYSSSVKASIEDVLGDDEFLQTVLDNCVSEEYKEKFDDLMNFIEERSHLLIKAYDIKQEKDDYYYYQTNEGPSRGWIAYNTCDNVIYNCSKKSKLSKYSLLRDGIDIYTYDEDEAVSLLDVSEYAYPTVEEALQEYKEVHKELKGCLEVIETKFAPELVLNKI